MPIMTLRDWSQRIRSADLRASSCLLAGRLRRTRMVDLGGFPAGDVRLRAWPEGSLCLREVDRIPIRLGWVPACPSCRWQSRRCRSRPARRRARAGRRL